MNPLIQLKGRTPVCITTGMLNTATGYCALTRNTTRELNTIGGSNMATDANALFLNDASSVNTANGAEALYHNTTAFFNSAVGYQALPRRDITSRRHLVGKEIRFWLVMVRWIPGRSVQTPPPVTPNF
jgi:hypothetical protein